MSNEPLKITTPQGTLIGTTYVSSVNGMKWDCFLGIPYAKPPIGALRFKAPEPLEPWDTTFKADKESSICIQFFITTKQYVGSEDCLYLNVFVPEPPSEASTLKPVIVNIHGGANNWTSGNIDHFGGPDFAMQNRDVLFVSINFRLHIFGFLNLGIPECAGNMGLKDQTMALRWVNQNIKYFGGDPNNVTLYGNSSGAACVHLHMMSPLSRGLFHKAIMQGGFALNTACTLTQNPLNIAFEIGHVMNFRGNNPKQLLRFLKTRTTMEIMHAVSTLRLIIRARSQAFFNLSPFSWSVESISEGAFIPEPIRELIKKTVRMPVLCSMTENEGALQFVTWDLVISGRGSVADHVSEYLHAYKMSPKTVEIIGNKVQSFYFGTKQDYNSCVAEYANFFGDLWNPEWYDVFDEHSKVAPVYIFLFTFSGGLNYQLKTYFPQTYLKLKGTSHGDDNAYFLCSKQMTIAAGRKFKFGEDERIVVSNMTKAFTNFAKTGNPNGNLSVDIHWEPHTPENPIYLKFDKDLEIVNGRMFPERTKLWKEILDYIKENEASVES